MGKGGLIRHSPVVSPSDDLILIDDHAADRNLILFRCFFRLFDGFLHEFDFSVCHLVSFVTDCYKHCAILTDRCN